MSYQHIPVMLNEVLEHLKPSAGKKYLDCTLGGAGYTLALAKLVGKKGQVIGIDLDEMAIKNAQALINEQKLQNITLINDNFKNLKTIVGENISPDAKFDGIVFDLGLSSAQLDDEVRGFSFKGQRPLDMSFGPANEKSTEEIVNHYPLLELTRIFREYGEEKHAYRIAKAIVTARHIERLKSTADLVRVIEEAIPFRYQSKIHPATRVFQALRMETNEELLSLEAVLPDAVSLLKTGGRIVVVSFHSGEDRIVKRYFKGESQIKIITKRPLIPAEEETKDNPRARSAKLRVGEKI
ncbi:MAG: 16S rRNA (cytosine(1402)-N(4))-methyltransferase RsmH [Patescibacteria group bacterium]